VTPPRPRATAKLGSVEIRREPDIVVARQRSREIARLTGFGGSEQVRIATAVSELARNAFQYARGGCVEFDLDNGPPPELRILVRDRGRGIANLDLVLSGRYRSPTGMGLGLIGAQRLMDGFHVETGPEGTRVELRKHLPGGAPRLKAAELGKALEQVAGLRLDPVEELQQQNRELLRTLDELRARQEELAALNRELEDTNRGVVALYAELDERADYLRRASELKSRFLSNMSHEFRTPVNTILSFCRLLLDGMDGELGSEQRTQVGFIQKAADGLSDLVNDLLDLSRVEAGKITVHAAEFDVRKLFGALRGMLRPLLVNSAVSLVVEEPEGIPLLATDESKVSQILRNFISNALKFTEHGEVRVAARCLGEAVVFTVSDTGIGIAAEDLPRIFEEYVQLDSPLQRRVKGTGLGLPLSKKLCELLGGRISVESEPGVGSTFRAEIPIAYRGPEEVSFVPEVTRLVDPTRFPVLVVEDNQETVFIYDKYLKGTPFQPIPAPTIAEARRALQHFRPVAIVLDVLLGNESSWAFLSELKGAAETRTIPVLLVTLVGNEHKARALGADGFFEKPVDRRWLVGQLEAAVRAIPRDRVLLIDDEEPARYLLRGLLAETRFEAIEASGGGEGIERARRERPFAVLVDLAMPGLCGEEVLERLRADPATHDLPLVVVTGRRLSEGEQESLRRQALAVLSKETPSRAVALKQLREALVRAGEMKHRLSQVGLRAGGVHG